jgi:beta-carotene hydroxylase
VVLAACNLKPRHAQPPHTTLLGSDFPGSAQAPEAGESEWTKRAKATKIPSMKLRFVADVRTLVWAFVLLPGASFLAYALPHHVAWILPLSLYTGFCAGVLAHYHNHCPVFENRRANAVYSIWISIFYGYPIFAWIPTHNRNHHKFVNGPGDAAITWRYTRRDTLLAAVVYFFVSSYWQDGIIKAFIAQARATNRAQHREIMGQYVCVAGAHLSMFALAVHLRGWRLGVITYLCSFGGTAGMGLWGMTFVNYIQHIHCDPSSRYNHSRNFVGPAANWLVFNSGYHTAHHEKAGAHWSTLPAIHAGLAANVDPDLNQASIAAYLFRTYVLGPVLPRFLPPQIGRPAYEGPESDAERRPRVPGAATLARR